jgi:hypothetical protein
LPASRTAGALPAQRRVGDEGTRPGSRRLPPVGAGRARWRGRPAAPQQIDKTTQDERDAAGPTRPGAPMRRSVGENAVSGCAIFPRKFRGRGDTVVGREQAVRGGRRAVADHDRHGNRSLNSALHKVAVVQAASTHAPRPSSRASNRRGRHAAKRCAPSSATSPARSSTCFAARSSAMTCRLWSRSAEARCASTRCSCRGCWTRAMTQPTHAEGVHHHRRVCLLANSPIPSGTTAQTKNGLTDGVLSDEAAANGSGRQMTPITNWRWFGRARPVPSGFQHLTQPISFRLTRPQGVSPGLIGCLSNALTRRDVQSLTDLAGPTVSSPILAMADSDG